LYIFFKEQQKMNTFLGLGVTCPLQDRLPGMIDMKVVKGRIQDED
jgi:hypothetical protein